VAPLALCLLQKLVLFVRAEEEGKLAGLVKEVVELAGQGLAGCLVGLFGWLFVCFVWFVCFFYCLFVLLFFSGMVK